MVLNELSLRPLANDVQGARQRMSDLVSTIAAATKLGVGRVLRTHRDFNSEEIAPGYPVAKWRNDHEVDREARSFFRTLTSKAPYLTDIVDPEIERGCETTNNRVYWSSSSYCKLPCLIFVCIHPACDICTRLRPIALTVRVSSGDQARANIGMST